MSEPEVGGTYGRDFPNGSLLYQKVGQDIEWGFFRYLFTGILWEKPDNGYGERQGLMKARDILLGKNVFINVRILKSTFADPDDEKATLEREALVDRATDAFDYEVNTFREMIDTGRTPVIITAARLTQDNFWENPGGYLHLYVMEEYPLLGLDDAFDFLTEGEIPALEEELYTLIGLFFKYRLAYYAVDFEYRYDAQRKVLYAVDIQNFHTVQNFEDIEAAESFFGGIIRNLRRSIDARENRAQEARARALTSNSLFEGSVEHWEDVRDAYPLEEFHADP